MAFRDFTEFPVWKRAFEALLQVYRMTQSFPNEERYGTVSDMRRAANSTVHHIAEGFGRYEPRDKTRFYKISRGSCYELISQSYTAYALHYITDEDHERMVSEYKEMIEDLDKLVKAVESRIKQ